VLPKARIDFAFFADSRAPANSPADVVSGNSLPANITLPANIVVLDVEGVPAEAFARVEQVLRREQGGADAQHLSNDDDKALGADASDQFKPRAVTSQE